MIGLYYTTTKGSGEIQSRPDKSLGGYKSGSLIKNDEFDNLFNEISNYTLNSEDQSQYTALILKNEDLINTKTNVNLWFEYPLDCYSNLEIAVVDLIQDSDGNDYMENIPKIHSSPVYAEFSEANGELNKQLIGDLLAGEEVGVWMKRTVLQSVARSDRENQIITDPEDSNQVIMTELAKSDTIEFKLSYD